MTLVLHIDAELTDNTLPIGYPAPNMNAGTKMLFDFSDARCNPHPEGVMQPGLTFTDIAGGAIAQTGAAGLYNISSADKGLTWPGSGLIGENQYVNFGSSHRWNLNTHWALGLWFTRTAIGADYTRTAGRGASNISNANNSSFSIDASVSDGGMRGTVLPAGTGTGVAHANSLVLDLNVPHLFVMEFEPGVALHQYMDGLWFRDVTTAATTLEPFDAGFLSAALWSGGTIHAMIAEDLAVSGRSGATFAAREWALRLPRFTA